MNLEDDGEGSPFAQKVDFVISIIETMLGGRAELNGYLADALPYSEEIVKYE